MSISNMIISIFFLIIFIYNRHIASNAHFMQAFDYNVTLLVPMVNLDSNEKEVLFSCHFLIQKQQY